VLGVFLLLAACTVGAMVIPMLVRMDEAHALSGLFGEPARETVIARISARVIQAAESQVRLARFVDALRAKAWAGEPFAIRRRSAGWCEWSFADGTRWLVRHRRRPPRELRRLIVAEATSAPCGAAVDAYGPGGGSPEDILEITDVADLP